MFYLCAPSLVTTYPLAGADLCKIIWLSFFMAAMIKRRLQNRTWSPNLGIQQVFFPYCLSM